MPSTELRVRRRNESLEIIREAFFGRENSAPPDRQLIQDRANFACFALLIPSNTGRITSAV